MSTLKKALLRIAQRPRDYTYREAKTLLQQLGFKECNMGKTSGSRVRFYRESDGRIIMLHKPHPEDTMTPGAVRDLADFVERLGNGDEE